jgi:hypothetical protein
MILFGIHHADARAKLLEPNSSKGLGENVCELLAGSDMLDVDLPGVDAVTDEMVPHLDVLAPILKHQVLSQLDGGFVVDEDGSGTALFAGHVVQQAMQPHSLTGRGGSCDILLLA